MNDDSTTHKWDSKETEDPCEDVYCGHGRECQLDGNGQPQCVCQRYCKKHKKMVCGSDGNLYPNHCELHRASCVTGTSITIDRKNSCLKRKGKKIENSIQSTILLLIFL
uniref:Kazal-like domain-containing protein n=1 Tax=Strigamia maritima TaxID=126957 RepID=T1JIN0_STRMM